MKAADLRKAILQAAVQGKLVPQNKNDEPASELLKRIQAKKAVLIKAGKLKKEKPILPITDDEIPYDLPEGWVWCRLCDLGSFSSGKTPDMTNSLFWDNGTVMWVSSKDMKSKYLSDSKMKITELTKESMTVYPAGTLLMVVRSGILKRMLPVCVLTVESTINQDIKAYSLFDLTMSEYVYFMLKGLERTILDDYTKQVTTVDSLRFDEFSRVMPVPLPPVEEQRRIVAKVDELMTMCDELEAAEKELDTLESDFNDYLPKSILQAAIQGKLAPQDKNDEPASELFKRIQAEKAALVKAGKLKKEKPLSPISADEMPYDLLDGWVWCRLGELVAMADNNNIQKNLSPNTIVSYVDIDAIDNKLYKIKATKKMPVNQLSTRARRVLSKGMIIYSLVRPYLDNIAVIERDEEHLIGSTGFAAFKTIGIPKEYLFAVLLCPYIRERFVSLLSGFNSPSISQTDFASTLFPLPPLAEQQRIIAKVDELMSMCGELKRVAEQPISHNNVVQFPTTPKENDAPIAIAARGEVEGMSDQAKKAIEDLFGEGE